MFRRAYSWLSRFILGNKLSLFSDIVIVCASGYLLLKKALGISISGWLINNAFQQPAVNAYVYISALTLIIALVVKILSLIFQHFPAARHAAVEPEEISECLQVMNKEISSHILKCDSTNIPNLRKLRDQHIFDVNVRLIVESLAEHITKSINTIKVKRKDVFISLYSLDKEEKHLAYELHYDPKRDLVKSRLIGLEDKEFAEYECVKCMNTTDTTSYLLTKEQYAKGNSKRHKTIKQYMGCKLETNGYDFGFLNIEFHNQTVFVDEDEMQDFMEENIFPFKLLLEYQYLKQEFFKRFEELDKHWEVE